MANNNTPKSVYPLASDQGNPIPLDVVMPQWSSIVTLAAGAKLELTLPESLNIISVHSDKVVRLTNGTSSVVTPDPGDGGGTNPGDGGGDTGGGGDDSGGTPTDPGDGGGTDPGTGNPDLIYTISPTTASGDSWYFQPISASVAEEGGKLKLGMSSSYPWIGTIALNKQYSQSSIGPGFIAIEITGSWDVKPTANSTGILVFNTDQLNPVPVLASDIQDKLVMSLVIGHTITEGLDNLQFTWMGDNDWPASTFTVDTLNVYYKYDASQDDGSGSGGGTDPGNGGGSTENWVPLYEKYDMTSLNDYSSYGVYDIQARSGGDVSINQAGRPQAKWSGDNALWQIDVTLNSPITLPNGNKLKLIMGGGFPVDVSQTPLQATMVIPSNNDQLAVLTGGPDSSSKDPQVVFTGTMNHDATFDNFRLYMGSNYPVPESYQTISSFILQFDQQSSAGALNTDATKLPGAIVNNTFIVIEHTLYELAVGNKLTVENISDEGAVVLVNGLVRWTQARNRQYGVS